MLSYAGVALSHPDAAFLAALAPYLDPTGEAEAAPENWGLPDADGTPPRVGVLRWPRTASRWACLTALATDAQADAIRREVARASGVALPLVMGDGTRSIETDLVLLPPRPLTQCGTAGSWLLDLVDVRYFWREQGAADVMADNTSTWATLLASCASALGATLALPTIPSAYLAPPPALTDTWSGSLPALLDTAASAVGMVVVRELDGTLSLLSPALSLSRHQANLVRTSRLAGGLYALP